MGASDVKHFDRLCWARVGAAGETSCWRKRSWAEVWVVLGQIGEHGEEEEEEEEGGWLFFWLLAEGPKWKHSSVTPSQNRRRYPKSGRYTSALCWGLRAALRFSV